MANKFGQTKIIPMAYGRDFAGVEFIVKIEKNEKITYSRVLPPNYEIKEEYSESLLMSAITKYDFIPYQGEIYFNQEYKEKLKSLQRELLKRERNRLSKK